jgi:hypothetical protein
VGPGQPGQLGNVKSPRLPAAKAAADYKARALYSPDQVGPDLLFFECFANSAMIRKGLF